MTSLRTITWGETTESASTIPITFRCPPELKRYIAEAAAEPGRTKTEVITGALELDRDLAQELRGERELLGEFAKAHSLSMKEELAVVLARLVKRGLETLRDPRVKKGKSTWRRRSRS